MAMIYGGVNFETTYDFRVQEFEPPIHKLIIYKRQTPGIDGEEPFAAQYSDAKITIVGVFAGVSHNWANFKAFENALTNTISVFADYTSTTLPSASTLQMDHISSDVYTECRCTEIRILQSIPKGGLSLPIRVEIVIEKAHPGVS